MDSIQNGIGLQRLPDETLAIIFMYVCEDWLDRKCIQSHNWIPTHAWRITLPTISSSDVHQLPKGHQHYYNDDLIAQWRTKESTFNSCCWSLKIKNEYAWRLVDEIDTRRSEDWVQGKWDKTTKKRRGKCSQQRMEGTGNILPQITLSLACKRFAAILSSSCFNNTISTGYGMQRNRSIALRSGTTGLHIDLSSECHRQYDVSEQFARVVSLCVTYCNNWTSLSLPSKFIKDAKCLQSLKLPSLKHLDYNLQPSAIHMQNIITSLDMPNLRSLVAVNFVHGLITSTTLTHFTFYKPYEDNPTTLVRFIIANPSLQHIDIALGCYYGHAMIVPKAVMINVQTLRIYMVSTRMEIFKAFMTAIETPNVEYYAVKRCGTTRGVDIQQLLNLTFQCEEYLVLKTFEFHAETHTEFCYSLPTKKMPNLRSLKLHTDFLKLNPFPSRSMRSLYVVIIILDDVDSFADASFRVKTEMFESQLRLAVPSIIVEYACV